MFSGVRQAENYPVVEFSCENFLQILTTDYTGTDQERVYSSKFGLPELKSVLLKAGFGP